MLINILVVSCGVPERIDNATLSGNNHNYGDMIIYTCLESFRLASGTLKRMCGPDGNWTGQPPVCLGKPVLNAGLM